ncbi:MAG: non-canonical purine NTP diphosphatase [Bacteroidales bacterium]
MRELIFATQNQHKAREIASMAGDLVNIVSLKDLKFIEDIPETSSTLEGNALQKAKYVYHRFNKACFADDTGLEVDALLGRPGVRSARYAGAGHDFTANMVKVLSEMAGVKDRKARFRTVIALILDQNKTYFFEGTVEGHLTELPRGDEGFGYDPIFVPDGYDQTFAEMTPELKNQISHRRQAFEKLVDFLKSIQ